MTKNVKIILATVTAIVAVICAYLASNENAKALRLNCLNILSYEQAVDLFDNVPGYKFLDGNNNGMPCENLLR